MESSARPAHKSATQKLMSGLTPQAAYSSLEDTGAITKMNLALQAGRGFKLTFDELPEVLTVLEYARTKLEAHVIYGPDVQKRDSI